MHGSAMAGLNEFFIDSERQKVLIPEGIDQPQPQNPPAIRISHFPFVDGMLQMNWNHDCHPQHRLIAPLAASEPNLTYTTLYALAMTPQQRMRLSV